MTSKGGALPGGPKVGSSQIALDLQLRQIKAVVRFPLFRVSHLATLSKCEQSHSNSVRIYNK